MHCSLDTVPMAGLISFRSCKAALHVQELRRLHLNCIIAEGEGEIGSDFEFVPTSPELRELTLEGLDCGFARASWPLGGVRAPACLEAPDHWVRVQHGSLMLWNCGRHVYIYNIYHADCI